MIIEVMAKKSKITIAAHKYAENSTLSASDKERLLKYVDAISGIIKRKTTDEELHKIREEAFLSLEKKYAKKNKEVLRVSSQ